MAAATASASISLMQERIEIEAENRRRETRRMETLVYLDSGVENRCPQEDSKNCTQLRWTLKEKHNAITNVIQERDQKMNEAIDDLYSLLEEKRRDSSMISSSSSVSVR